MALRSEETWSRSLGCIVDLYNLGSILLSFKILQLAFIHTISYHIIQHPYTSSNIKHQEYKNITRLESSLPTRPNLKRSTINNRSQSDMPSITVWYCCSCGFGPCNDSLDYFCPSCQERRCYNCKTSRISNRYGYGLPREVETNPYPKASTSTGFNPNAYNVNAPSLPFNISQQHLEGTSLTLTPTQRPPTCLATGHRHLADGPSISAILQHGGLTKKSPSSYYCCQCHDGPKLYDVQPVCINCDHQACSSCTPAK